MINAELIQQTEARYSERQGIRQEREAKIRAGTILQADTPERVTIECGDGEGSVLLVLADPAP